MLKLQSDNLPEEQQSKHTGQDEKHAEMEISTELLQQSSSKEALFVNEGADVKYEFGRTRFEVDGLEQKLNGPTITKEHNVWNYSLQAIFFYVNLTRIDYLQ
jgi:hypothetical protein